jgi:hypothetical protein
VVAPDDALALAAGLERMLSAPPAMERATPAAEPTVRFSSALMATQYLDRYQRIRERPS